MTFRTGFGTGVGILKTIPGNCKSFLPDLVDCVSPPVAIIPFFGVVLRILQQAGIVRPGGVFRIGIPPRFLERGVVFFKRIMLYHSRNPRVDGARRRRGGWRRRGGAFGVGRPFLGRPFLGRPFLGRPFLGRPGDGDYIDGVGVKFFFSSPSGRAPVAAMPPR